MFEILYGTFEGHSVIRIFFVFCWVYLSHLQSTPPGRGLSVPWPSPCLWSSCLPSPLSSPSCAARSSKVKARPTVDVLFIQLQLRNGSVTLFSSTRKHLQPAGRGEQRVIQSECGVKRGAAVAPPQSLHLLLQQRLSKAHQRHPELCLLPAGLLQL